MGRNGNYLGDKGTMKYLVQFLGHEDL